MHRKRPHTTLLARALGRPTVLATVAGLLTPLVGGTADAQSNEVFIAAEPALAARFSESPDTADPPGFTSIRRRIVRIDTALLTRARIRAQAAAAGFPGDVADGPVLTLNLFDDVELEGIVERAEPTASSTGYALFGGLRPAGDDPDPSDWDNWDMTLLVYDDVVAGTIRNADEVYDIRSVGESVHVITQVGVSLPPDDPPLVSPPPSGTNSGTDAVPETAAVDDGSVIDVAVFYTPAAQFGAGSLLAVSDMRQLVDRLFADTNAALRDSGVSLRMNLVSLSQVSFRETLNQQQDLHWLKAHGDGIMDDVHSVRDAYGADLVHVLVDRSLGGSLSRFSCGIAEIGTEYSPDAAFGMTHYSCTHNYTFAHELGHNLGLHHDRYETLQRERRTFTYHHGYVNQRAFQSGAPVDSRWHTVMAYPIQCEHFGFPVPPGGQYSCTPLRYFSNPSNTYRGDPMGVPASHPSMHVDGPAHAVRRIGELQRQVANYRDSRGGGAGGDPDLVVDSAAVSNSTPAPGQSFTFSATVRNRGAGASVATNLLYGERQAGAARFSLVGTDHVDGLAPSGIRRKSIPLTAPTMAGFHEYVACVEAVAENGDSTNDCSQIVGLTVGGGGAADLVVHSARVSEGTVPPGALFTFSATVRNQGAVASTEGGVWFQSRREGEAWMDVLWGPVRSLLPSEEVMESADFVAPAMEGTYFYRACVYSLGWEADESNNCSGAARLVVGGSCRVEPLGLLSARGSVFGSWGRDCVSSHRPGRYARHYSFEVVARVTVQIDLRSGTDTYLLLLSGGRADGAIVAENDDVERGVNTNSRIVMDLAGGTYTIEATTYEREETGTFGLTVGEEKHFTDDPIVAGTPIKAVHIEELRMRIDELRVHIGFRAGYSWVDPTIRRGVTEVKAVHLEQLRDAVNELYGVFGRRPPTYREVVRPGLGIAAEHFNELRRAIEAL